MRGRASLKLKDSLFPFTRVRSNSRLVFLFAPRAQQAHQPDSCRVLRARRYHPQGACSSQLTAHTQPRPRWGSNACTLPGRKEGLSLSLAPAHSRVTHLSWMGSPFSSCAALSSISCCAARSETSENPRLGRFVNNLTTFGALPRCGFARGALRQCMHRGPTRWCVCGTYSARVRTSAHSLRGSRSWLARETGFRGFHRSPSTALRQSVCSLTTCVKGMWINNSSSASDSSAKPSSSR